MKKKSKCEIREIIGNEITKINLAINSLGQLLGYSTNVKFTNSDIKECIKELLKKREGYILELIDLSK